MRRRIVLGIAAVLLCIVASTVLADPDCAVSHCVYLPAVVMLLPTPTPIPPPLSSLVLQPSDIQSGYIRDTNEVVTNEAAAATYPKPTDALKAFETQGRESAWFVRYSSDQYLFSGAAAVGNETFRYLTSAGATQGQAYNIAKVRKDNPTYQAIPLTIPGYPLIALKRTFTSNGTDLVLFYISVQVGRYVTDMQVGGLDGIVSAQEASNYTQRTVYKLINTPQRTSQGVTTRLPEPNAVRDAITMQ